MKHLYVFLIFSSFLANDMIESLDNIKVDMNLELELKRALILQSTKNNSTQESVAKRALIFGNKIKEIAMYLQKVNKIIN